MVRKLNFMYPHLHTARLRWHDKYIIIFPPHSLELDYVNIKVINRREIYRFFRKQMSLVCDLVHRVVKAWKTRWSNCWLGYSQFQNIFFDRRSLRKKNRQRREINFPIFPKQFSSSWSELNYAYIRSNLCLRLRVIQCVKCPVSIKQ